MRRLTEYRNVLGGPRVNEIEKMRKEERVSEGESEREVGHGVTVVGTSLIPREC